jgi:uncharacterized membrane protein YhaH (DUF805 family)
MRRAGRLSFWYAALGLAAIGAGVCALVLMVLGLPLAWPALLWAGLCGFLAGALAAAPWWR